MVDIRDHLSHLKYNVNSSTLHFWILQSALFTSVVEHSNIYEQYTHTIHCFTFKIVGSMQMHVSNVCHSQH